MCTLQDETVHRSSLMKDYIERVTEGEDLTQDEARAAASAVFEDATEAQIGALLSGLRAKGETETEIAGFAEGMRDAARTIEPDRRPLVVACGAGVPVAKHGNYSVSSNSGSADVLEEVGVDVEAEPTAVEQAIEDDGIGFMLAPVFHPAMKAVIGPRKELGMRTIFNVLGPLTNPAGADAQVVGVYDPDLVPVLARSLAHMSVDRALVVHGSGMDEIAVHDETTVAAVDGDDIEEYTLGPADLGLDSADVSAVAGGTPEENAEDLRGIVEGEVTGAKRDIILANAGAALYVAGEADSLEDGAQLAAKAIDDGGAADQFEELRTTVKA